MVQLNSDYRDFVHQTNRLTSLLTNINSLSPQYAKLVSEIVMLRLFDILEGAFHSIAVKLICGADYVDGTSPNLATRARSAISAESLMENYGRLGRPRNKLRWTQIREIKKNTEHIIDPTEKYIVELDRNSTFVEEMRWIRNRIAHTNKNSRANYKRAVINYYGGYVRSVTPGTLLLSPRNSPVLMEQYLRKSQVLLKAMLKA